jgi:YVTN family beta-propeller protein
MKPRNVRRGAALLLIALAASGCSSSDGDRGGQVVRFDSTPAEATPAAPAPGHRARVTDTIKVGSKPHGVAFGAGAVWVVTSGDSRLVRIDPGRRAVAGGADAGERPGEVAVAGGFAYVTSQDSNSVLRFRAGRHPALDGTIPLRSEPEGLAVSGNVVWVSSTNPGLVTPIDARTFAAGAPVSTPGSAPVQISVGRRGLWVTDEAAGTAALLDFGTLQPRLGPVRVGHNPRDVLEAFGDTWVVATDDDRVQRLSGETVRGHVAVGTEPHHIAASRDALWVTSAGAGTVSRIDPATGKVTATVKTGGTPLGIAYGAGALWVSDFGSDRVWRIAP